jgi:uncharacterized membrane protein YhiD involved in acid resistance
MKNSLFKPIAFIAVLFCAINISAQTSDWIVSDTKDDIEVSYRFEKSGLKTYEVEIKIINNRAKDVDVLVSIEPKNKTKSYSQDEKVFIKLKVKAKSTTNSEKIVVNSEILSVKIVDWCNSGSKSCNTNDQMPL